MSGSVRSRARRRGGCREIVAGWLYARGRCSPVGIDEDQAEGYLLVRVVWTVFAKL